MQKSTPDDFEKGEIMDSVNPNLIVNVVNDRKRETMREAAQMRLCRQAEAGRHGRNPGLIARLAAALSRIGRLNDTAARPSARSQGV